MFFGVVVGLCVCVSVCLHECVCGSVRSVCAVYCGVCACVFLRRIFILSLFWFVWGVAFLY